MSAHVSQPKAEYLGILNGVVYRLDTEAAGSGRLFGLVPFKVQSPALAERFAVRHAEVEVTARSDAGTPDVDASTDAGLPPLLSAEASLDGAVNAKAEAVTTLFKRDGAEPLRAGHPDLWNLLVAGTCLAGSTFRSV